MRARIGRGRLCEVVTCPQCELSFDNRSPLPVTPPTGIEYLDRFFAVTGGPDPSAWGGVHFEGIEVYTLRHRLVSEYAWAIPSQAALAKLVSLGPIVEMGAGGGYWAMLLRERGVDVTALDEQPHANHWVKRGWSEVQPGKPDDLPLLGSKSTLFLCWPPMSSMALRCLARYRGRRVAYIGEHQGGCCADDAFFAALERIYQQTDEITIPQWPGIHDYLSVWEKRERL